MLSTGDNASTTLISNSENLNRMKLTANCKEIKDFNQISKNSRPGGFGQI